MPEFDIYTGLLRMSAEFQKGSVKSITYVTGKTKLSALYPIAENAKGESDMARAVSLLNFISANMFHNGSALCKSMAPENIMSCSFRKGKECGVNCMALSTALTACLLEVGIKARTVFMMPASPYDADNHVVAEAWLRDRRKWIMLDPTYNLYAYSENEPMSVLELRSRLARQDSVYLGDCSSYNGSPIDKSDVLSYYAKDIYWFQADSQQGGKANSDSEMLSFAPLGYDVKAARIANIDYRIKKFGESEQLLNWRKSEEKNTIVYGDAELLMGEPK